MADGATNVRAGPDEASPKGRVNGEPSANGNGPGRKMSPLPHASTLKDRIKPKGPPGGYDSMPLPEAEQGFTIRFTFKRATNLPPADFSTVSSDPFLVATLRSSSPKRHKEDPDVWHRTRTLRRTTEPEWHDEWVVANVPPSGFSLKCRMYDEDSPDQNDRLGNVTIKIPRLYDSWEGIPSDREFEAKKRVISRRAIALKGIASLISSNAKLTPRLCIGVEVLGRSDPPYAQIYTAGPTTWVKHFSPMIGRLAGTKVDKDKGQASIGRGQRFSVGGDKSQKYDFQANEMQLKGPVPWKLYHRFVEFKPVIGSMFSSTGLRGKVLNKALHKQHRRIYNFDRTTEYGEFEACSENASTQFLRMAHFDEGGRLFTYVLTLDGIFRFTETGKEFGIDLLSKHTMHSDVDAYIAYSGEFFIRRFQHADASDDPDPKEKTHPQDPIPGGPPEKKPPTNPSYYQLIIDNDSGTYRPEKSLLPELKAFLEQNFPGLGIAAMHWEDKELQDLKQAQQSVKKDEGNMINLVMNRSQSSISSAESELLERDGHWEHGHKSKREAAYEAIENPKKLKDAVGSVLPTRLKDGVSKGEISQT